MIEPTPITGSLDLFLREVVRALHVAVSQGIRIVESDPAGADRVIDDCKATLAVIMAGRVQEWITP